MRAGGSKQKGSSFERDICTQLSLWVTAGARDDCFWRSAVSGGRSTVRGKKGKSTKSQDADITAIAPEGHAFLSKFIVECKHVKDLNLSAALIKGKGPITEFWQKLYRQGLESEKWPILIARQNSQPILVFIHHTAASNYFEDVKALGMLYEINNGPVSVYLLSDLMASQYEAGRFE